MFPDSKYECDYLSDDTSENEMLDDSNHSSSDGTLVEFVCPDSANQMDDADADDDDDGTCAMGLTGVEIRGWVSNISDHLWTLTHISRLSLNNNNLSEISGKIGRLVNLTYLDVSCNQLVSVPAEIGDLSKLREFLLEYNKITELPAELGKLQNLKCIAIAHNSLPYPIMKLFDKGSTKELMKYYANLWAQKSFYGKVVDTTNSADFNNNSSSNNRFSHNRYTVGGNSGQ